MKKILFLFLFFSRSMVTYCQLQDIEQLKLDLEKLVQMKMMLSNMYNGYSTIANGYNQLTGLAKGNFDLHKTYLDQLFQVAPQIKNYPIIQTIIDNQSAMVSESIAAYSKYLKSGLFSGAELGSLKNRVDQIKSLMNKKLDQLNLVLTPGALRMSDQERISTIDRIDKDVGDALSSVRILVKEQNAVAATRAQQKKDNSALRVWYGFKQ